MKLKILQNFLCQSNIGDRILTHSEENTRSSISPVVSKQDVSKQDISKQEKQPVLPIDEGVKDSTKLSLSQSNIGEKMPFQPYLHIFF